MEGNQPQGIPLAILKDARGDSASVEEGVAGEQGQSVEGGGGNAEEAPVEHEQQQERPETLGEGPTSSVGAVNEF